MIKKMILYGFFLFLAGCVSYANETPDLQIVKAEVPFSLTPVAHNTINHFLKGSETKESNDMVFYFNQPLESCKPEFSGMMHMEGNIAYQNRMKKGINSWKPQKRHITLNHFGVWVSTTCSKHLNLCTINF